MGEYSNSITLVSVADGDSTYTYVRYADDAQGTHMSETPLSTSEYVAIQVTNSPTPPSTGWVWTKFVGDPGAPGTPATQYYTYIRYSANSDGSNYVETPTSSTKYVGICVVTSTTPPAYNNSAWKWSQYVGNDGVNANAYTLEVNHEEIYKFTTDGNLYELSSSQFEFSAFKEENNIRTQINLNSGYTIIFSLIADSSWSESLYESVFSDLFGNGIVTKYTGTNTVIFNVDEIINPNLEDYKEDEEDSQEVAEYKAKMRKFIEILQTKEPAFIFKLYEGNTAVSTALKVSKVIRLAYGSSDVMAKFSVTAAAINAAVDNSKLIFNQDGLTIDGGNFQIIDGSDNNKQYLTYTQEGGLKILGDAVFSGKLDAAEGTFAGDISAATGTFTGGIEASSGNIGGFEITTIDVDENQQSILRSTDENASLILNGTTGEIIATKGSFRGDITGATGHFTGGITAAEGTIGGFEIGTNTLSSSGLVLDSSASSIYANNNSWYVTPSVAKFENIIATGEIISSVFKINETQSVGGSMMFKPSYKVEEVSSDNLTLTLEADFDARNVAVGDYIKTVGGQSVVTQIASVDEDDKTITLTSAVPSNINGIILLGKHGSIILGANSQEENGFLAGRGFSASEMVEYKVTADTEKQSGKTYYEYDENSNTFTETSDNTFIDGKTYYEKLSSPAYLLKAFLGDLAALNLQGVSLVNGKYGLYSDNVVLNGSLTTRIKNQGNNSTWAGVNTLSGVAANIFNGTTVNDTSNIVFWAGSQGTSDTDIQEAPFQVTEGGSVYASSGLFTGIIVSKSKIKGADIYAARIHGAAKNDADIGDEDLDYGLAFFDTSEGIVFKTGGTEAQDWDDATTVFRIATNGFLVNNSPFISIGEGNVDFYARNLQLSGNLLINKIELPNLLIEGYSFKDKNNNNKELVNLRNNNDLLVLSSTDDMKLSIGRGKAKFEVSELSTNNTFVLGVEGNNALLYKKVSNGYDLYVE